LSTWVIDPSQVIVSSESEKKMVEIEWGRTIKFSISTALLLRKSPLCHVPNLLSGLFLGGIVSIQAG